MQRLHPNYLLPWTDSLKLPSPDGRAPAAASDYFSSLSRGGGVHLKSHLQSHFLLFPSSLLDPTYFQFARSENISSSSINILVVFDLDLFRVRRPSSLSTSSVVHSVDRSIRIGARCKLNKFSFFDVFSQSPACMHATKR
jgi:hypothetical protein